MCQPTQKIKTENSHTHTTQAGRLTHRDITMMMTTITVTSIIHAAYGTRCVPVYPACTAHSQRHTRYIHTYTSKCMYPQECKHLLLNYTKLLLRKDVRTIYETKIHKKKEE